MAQRLSGSRARHVYRRLALAAIALAVAAAPGACGGGGDGSADGADRRADTADRSDRDAERLTRSGGDPNGTEEQRIRAIYDTVVDHIYASRFREVCAHFSRDALGRLGGPRGCFEQFDEYFSNLGSGLRDRPRVVRLQIEGERAHAGARTRKSNVYRIPFVLEGGEWKIDGGFETAGL